MGIDKDVKGVMDSPSSPSSCNVVAMDTPSIHSPCKYEETQLGDFKQTGNEPWFALRSTCADTITYNSSIASC